MSIYYHPSHNQPLSVTPGKLIIRNPDRDVENCSTLTADDDDDQTTFTTESDTTLAISILSDVTPDTTLIEDKSPYLTQSPVRHYLSTGINRPPVDNELRRGSISKLTRLGKRFKKALSIQPFPSPHRLLRSGSFHSFVDNENYQAPYIATVSLPTLPSMVPCDTDAYEKEHDEIHSSTDGESDPAAPTPHQKPQTPLRGILRDPLAAKREIIPSNYKAPPPLETLAVQKSNSKHWLHRLRKSLQFPSESHHRSLSILHLDDYDPSPTSTIRFNTIVTVRETYSRFDYNREPDTTAICSRLTPEAAQQIKAELNEYKWREMKVHPSSQIYTHIFPQH